MKLGTSHDIQSTLKRFNGFEESIITSIKPDPLLLEWSVSLNLVRDSNGEIRKDLNIEKIVTLKFSRVQLFKFDAAINDHMIAHPDQINWGINEVAMIRFEQNDIYLRHYKSAAPPSFHHVSILWEGPRRIDIVFSELEVIQE